MKKIIQISNSPENTFKAGFEVGSKIQGSCLIGLTGELGAGKTCFTKGFAEALGVKELITSPTFLGVSESYSGKLPFIHMDFYKKVISKDLIEYFLKNKSAVLIEWVENFEEVFKKKLTTDINVLIEYLKDKDGIIVENKRKIIIEM